MGWRRDLRLMDEYSSPHAFALDLISTVAIPVGPVLAVVNRQLEPFVLAVVCAAYLVFRLRTVRSLARRDLARGGPVLHVLADVQYGATRFGGALHRGQHVVIDIDGEAIDAVCQKGSVRVGERRRATVIRADGALWPPLAYGDRFEFVATSATIGGYVSVDMLRDPRMRWRAGRN